MAVNVRVVGLTVRLVVGAAIVKVTGIDCGVLVEPGPVTVMVEE